jgi:hypothetical protein
LYTHLFNIKKIKIECGKKILTSEEKILVFINVVPQYIN